MKILKIIKFICVLVLFELCFGSMCYQYGVDDKYAEQLILYLVYAILVGVISYVDLKVEDNSTKINVVQSIVLLAPNIVILILSFINEVNNDSKAFFIAYFVVVAIVLLLEVVTMIFKMSTKR